MVIVSCSTKLHAFNLAEQLERHGLLDTFYTTYAYQKNVAARRFIRRIDLEKIPAGKISTNLPVGALHKWYHDKYQTNAWFESSVAKKLQKNKTARVFIGWSGMSLQALRQARKQGMITVLERGSSHICFQNNILQEEYLKFGKNFEIDKRVIEKELKEYEEADYISVPSDFVKQTFAAYGVNENKIVVNAYGASTHFATVEAPAAGKKDKFIVVYLGTLSIRKGLIYLFKALQQLSIVDKDLEVWYIGSVAAEMKEIVEEYKKPNWKFFGHVDHYTLKDHLSRCDVGVQCSLEEGLSMVIPQMMSCGVPVIVTPNSGGGNIIRDNVNGCIVPVRSPEAIAERIDYLYNNREFLGHMKQAAEIDIRQGYTWDDYGNRYVSFINQLLK